MTPLCLIMVAALFCMVTACQRTTSEQTGDPPAKSSTPQDSTLLPTDSAPSAPKDPMLLPTALPDAPPDVPDAVPEDLASAWEVWQLLNEQHVDRAKLEDDEFEEGAIRGIIQTLGDPHTGYLPPEAFQIENEDLYGSFEGIGARVEMRPDGKLFVSSPIEGGPAERAGIRPGDLVLAVNGESIEGLSILEAVNKIRGPKGTEVLLLVRHLGDVEDTEIAVVRDTIPLESVFVRSRPDDKFGHIRISTFYEDTPQKLSDAVRAVLADGAEGVILDVRDNPGGTLSSVVQVVDMFVDGGIALYQMDGAGHRSELPLTSPTEFSEVPLVLLANEGSASASEILAGALQDYERAPVVGATTYGKGSVNILRRLSNGGGITMTIAKWYTPSGRLIEGNGIDPDYDVTARDQQKADTNQFEKAIEVMESIAASP